MTDAEMQELGIVGFIPSWALDQIVVQIEVHLGWQDAVMLLFRRRLDLAAYVACEKAPGRVETSTRVLPWRPRWPWRRQDGYGVMEANPK